MKKEENTQRASSYWKRLTALLCLGWVVIWIYRSMLTPIYPQVMQTLDLHSNQQIGIIASIYFFAYVLLQVPAGMISDKFDKRLILSFGFLVFALATFLMSASQSLVVIYIASALAGLSGAFFYGAAFSLSGQDIPANKRNVATAIINSGSSVGMVIGLSGSSWLVLSQSVDWQLMLKGVALIMVLTFALYYLFIRRDNAASTQSAPQNILTEGSSENSYFTVKKLAVYFVLFCSCYAYFLVVSWLPNFLQTERHFSGSSAGMVASLVGLASIPGALIFSMVADKYRHYKYRIMLLQLVLAAVMLLISAHAQDAFVIMLGLVGYGLLGKLALDPLLISTISDLSNKKKLATSLSIYNFFGMSASFIAPWLTGNIADRTGSTLDAFNLAGIILATGAVVLVVVFIFTSHKQNRSQYEYR
ncbi:MFS transporter [Candidatus Pantoea formicae]|uniref:MFS transporter n=1 Tax=Candidatus Pantoea formicae TaxID=2608355 RepID=UPI003ED88CB2